MAVGDFPLIKIWPKNEALITMLEHSIAKQSIASIRNKKLNLNPNTELTERIKLLKREMVKLSFQKNRKDDINLIVGEISRLRGILKKAT